MAIHSSMDRPFLTWLLKTAEQLGVDCSRVDQSLVDSIEMHSQNKMERPLFEDYLSLLAYFEAQTGDHEIGLHLGERIAFSEIGTYGYMLLYAATVEGFLELIQHYECLLVSVKAPRWSVTGNIGRLEYHIVYPSNSLPRQDIALNLAAYTTTIRNYVDPGWRPVSAGFEYPQPEDISEYQRVFGDALFFDQAVSYIEIQAEVLSYKIRDTDPALLQVVRRYADQLLVPAGPEQTICERVQSILMELIGQQPATQEAVAARLNMSRSSLQRYLKCQGTNFRDLRDAVIYSLGREALANTDVPVSQIALALGYSETSSFDRAFNRMSGGLSPLSYRKEPNAADRVY